MTLGKMRRPVRGTVRRLLALLVLWGMAAALLPPAAMAAEGELTAPVTISTGVPGTGSVQVEVRWDDGWFVNEASTYRHELTAASMALSGAAYLGGRNTGIQAALKSLGFDGIQSYHYNPAPETAAEVAAYTFAVKEIPVPAGGSAWLTAIVVRGTGEYMEWAGNFNMGGGSDHEGFAQARDELLARLERYLSDRGLSGEKRKTMKFLVTGHSRGGAVANLTAAHLTEAARETGGSVYAYTFAAPTVSFHAAVEGYQNIFNIISGDDLVTQVPLPAWGCGRYGLDLHLPTRAGYDGDYDAAFEKMNRRYIALTGRPYAVYQDGAAVEKMTSAIYRLVPNASGASMAMLSALFTGNFSGLSDLVRENSLAAILLGRRALTLSNELTPLIQQEAGGMASAHCMASYYSWLTAWETVEEAEQMFSADLYPGAKTQ